MKTTNELFCQPSICFPSPAMCKVSSKKNINVLSAHTSVSACPVHAAAPTLHSALVLVAQLCPTLYNPMDYTVHGILQARILKWVAFPFLGDLPNPGIEPRSPALWADSLSAEPPEKPRSLQGHC